MGETAFKCKGYSIAAGALAPVVFALVVMLVAAGRPGYQHHSRPISDLGAKGARGSLAMNVLGFGLTGALVALFAPAFVAVGGATPATVSASVSWFLLGGCFTCLGIWPFPHPYHLEFTLYCTILAFV